MTKTKAVASGAIFLLGAIGCGGTSDGAARRSATPDPAPAIVREENRAMSKQNWQEVENFLAQRGYNPGKVDGIEDNQTRQAITNFQQQNKLKATGMLDNQTLVRMSEQGAQFTGSFGTQLQDKNKNSE